MKRYSILLLVAILSLTACKKVPITGRKSFSLVGQGSLVATADQQYDQFLNEAQVVNGTTEANQVQRIGKDVATATESYLKENGYSDLIEDFKWEYNLVKSDQVNAWCMPGGKIAVYTGIMPITKTDEGLATVMGHEVAHAVAHHSGERMSTMLVQQLGGVALSVALQSQPQQTQELLMMAYGTGTQLGVILPYSRKHELEADKLGLVFMARAGYDPRKATEFWQRMQAQSQGAPPEFLSTHPNPERRIRDINSYMNKALKEYRPKN